MMNEEITNFFKNTPGDNIFEFGEIIKLKVQNAVPVRYCNAGYAHGYYAKIKEGKSYCFTGKVGCGKTFLLTEICNSYTAEKIMKKAKSELESYDNIEHTSKLDYSRSDFYKITEVPTLLRNEFSKEARLIEKMKNAKVLFLDDMGTENKSDWWIEQFFVVIDYRYEKIKPIVASTNLNIKEMAMFYGDRIASRMVEMCEFVNIQGDDRRFKKLN